MTGNVLTSLEPFWQLMTPSTRFLRTATKKHVSLLGFTELDVAVLLFLLPNGWARIRAALARRVAHCLQCKDLIETDQEFFELYSPSSSQIFALTFGLRIVTFCLSFSSF
jgi:hypothetical protein